jgi:hypothetical protein
MMEITILVLVGLTSMGAYLAAVRTFGWSRLDLVTAFLRMLDVVGASTMFFATNLALGIAAILAMRGLTGRFVSLYVLDDISLLLLSVVQGLLFEYWRHAERAANRPPAAGRP